MVPNKSEAEMILLPPEEQPGVVLEAAEQPVATIPEATGGLALSQADVYVESDAVPEESQPLPSQGANGNEGGRRSRSRGRRTKEFDPDDLVRRYLDEIGRYPLLTKDDERELAQRIEAGNAARSRIESKERLSPGQKRKLYQTIREGEEAHRQFVNSNLRLVVSIAKKYHHSGLPLLDIIQEGNLGLIRAVDKFDWRKGFKFSTYATWWIRQSIDRGIANTGRTIRWPVHAWDTAHRIWRAFSDLEMQYGRSPRPNEIAAHLEIPEQRVTEVLMYPNELLSFYQRANSDTETTIGEFVADPKAHEEIERNAHNRELRDTIPKLLELLDGRERLVIALRFGLDGEGERKLEAIGEMLGLTRERVRQIEAKALAKMRHPSVTAATRDLLM